VKWLAKPINPTKQKPAKKGAQADQCRGHGDNDQHRSLCVDEISALLADTATGTWVS